MGLYIVVCIGLYFGQDKVIFAAHPYPNNARFVVGNEVEVPLTEEIEMNCLLIPDIPGQKSKKVIMYLHGNKGNIKRGIYQTRVMKDKGCDIFLIDYRGYGKTEGRPINDAQMHSDADKAYQYLKTQYREENIYVIGYSLGTGMASYIASQNNPKHLFLVAPFTSLTDIKNQWLWMFPDFLLKYKLSNYKHLKDVKCGVSIVHGTNDEVVNYAFSKKLKTTYPEIKLVTAPGRSHRQIIFDSELSSAISEIVLKN